MYTYLVQLLVPIACFTVIAALHLQEFRSGKGARKFFSNIRLGWIQENYLKGQQACNTTRDYIRASLFFANTSILMVVFVAGLAGNTYNNCYQEGCSHHQVMFITKLGCLAAVLLSLFFMFVQCTRFAVHFSFMINTRYLGKKSLPTSLIERTFNKAHQFYSLGTRLYYLTIPIFAWIFHEWALLCVTPLYLFVIHQLESTEFLGPELCLDDTPPASPATVSTVVDENGLAALNQA